MGHIEDDGKSYCDWRITIENCEGEEFFQAVYHYATICMLISIPALIFSLSIRKFVFGESLNIFPACENGLTIFLIIILLSFAVQYLSVLVNGPEVVSGVLWTISYPIINANSVYHASFLRRALPKASMPQSTSKWHLNENARTFLAYAFALYLFVAHVVIISTSQAFSSRGQVSIGKRLERVGLVLTSFNCLVLTSVVTSSCFFLRRKVMEVMESSHGRGIDDTFLGLIVNKLQQTAITTIIHGIFQTTFFMLLAFYPRFFTNLSFSKALIIIVLGIQPTNGLFYCFYMMGFDIKKWLHKKHSKELKEKSSRNSEKKEEEAPSTRFSVSDKDQIQQIIDDLKPERSSHA